MFSIRMVSWRASSSVACMVWPSCHRNSRWRRKGRLVFSQRTAGRFVTGDVSMIENAKLRLADQCVENFLSEMAKLGCGRDEVIALLQDRKEEES